MEGFSFVTPVTGLNRPNTGKEDDDEYVNHTTYKENKAAEKIRADCLPIQSRCLFACIL
jgi:hypothetical protein